MDEDMINISDEQLKKLSLDQLVDLKVELDDLVERINDLINDCNEALNS